MTKDLKEKFMRACKQIGGKPFPHKDEVSCEIDNPDSVFFAIDMEHSSINPEELTEPNELVFKRGGDITLLTIKKGEG